MKIDLYAQHESLVKIEKTKLLNLVDEIVSNFSWSDYGNIFTSL